MLHGKRLAVVLITRNEAELLPERLASVSWADEIVVLEPAALTKRAISPCRRVYASFSLRIGWVRASRRQLAQAYASGDYIPILNADERVMPHYARRFKTCYNTSIPMRFQLRAT